MNNSRYTDDELIVLYLAQALTGKQLRSFEKKLKQDPELSKKVSEFKELDSAFFESYQASDQMPPEFEVVVKDRLNVSHNQKTHQNFLTKILRTIFNPSSLIPAGAGAAITAFLISSFSVPVLVFKGTESSNGNDPAYGNFFENETPIEGFEQKPWMLDKPILTEVVIVGSSNEFSRTFGNGLNKVAIGESFYLYLSAFEDGEVLARYLDDKGNVEVLKKANVSKGEIVQVSRPAGFPWAFTSIGRDQIEILFNNRLIERILISVE